jgi:hypothetical protein
MLRRIQAALRQSAMRKANGDLMSKISTALIAQRRRSAVKVENLSSFVKVEVSSPVMVGFYPAAGEVQIHGPTEPVMKELRQFLIDDGGLEVGELFFDNESMSWVLPGIRLK